MSKTLVALVVYVNIYILYIYIVYNINMYIYIYVNILVADGATRFFSVPVKFMKGTPFWTYQHPNGISVSLPDRCPAELNFSMFLPSRNQHVEQGLKISFIGVNHPSYPFFLAIYRGVLTPFIRIVWGNHVPVFANTDTSVSQVLVLVRRPPRRCYTTQ